MNKLTYIEEIEEQRAKKDSLFKDTHHSPLTDSQKSTFSKLNYFQVDENFKYTFELKEYSQKNEINMMTSKGHNQKYIRFGFIEFEVNSEVSTLTIYRDHHSDYLFVPFKL